ncbi:POK7 protein, partial [Calyptomena viridis]|nr:POK7 protein [Calyptomena viridis]
LQQLMWSINWVRPCLGFTTEQLTSFFSLMKGDPDLHSRRVLTLEAEWVLSDIEAVISIRWVYRIELDVAVTLFVILCGLHPTGIIGQWNIEREDPLHIL